MTRISASLSGSETKSSAREAGEQKKRRSRRRRIMRSSAAGRNRERQPLCSMCIPRNELLYDTDSLEVTYVFKVH